jgi:hypothetical protein
MKASSGLLTIGARVPEVIKKERPRKYVKEALLSAIVKS